MKPRGTIFFHVIGAMPRKPGFFSCSGIAGVAADEADAATGASRRGACRRSWSRPPGNLPNWLGTYDRWEVMRVVSGRGEHRKPC